MKKFLAVFFLAYMVVLSGCGGGGGGTTQPNATATSFLAWTGSADTANEFRLVRLDGQTGQVTNIGGDDFYTALVYGPDGTLYGVGSDLAVINPANGSASRIGAFSFGGNPILMASAAFSANGNLYAVENASPNRIFSVDLTNATLTLVGTPSATLEAIAFSSNGTMYAAFADLFVLSSTDASIMNTIGHIYMFPNNNSSTVYIGSMTFGGDGSLYGINKYPSSVLYKVDTSTGVATPINFLASGNIVAIVAEQSPKLKSAASSQLYASPHKPRADLLAMERQLNSKESMVK